MREEKRKVEEKKVKKREGERRENEKREERTREDETVFQQFIVNEKAMTIVQNIVRVFLHKNYS